MPLLASARFYFNPPGQNILICGRGNYAMSRTADDFAPIRAAREKIHKEENDALSGKTPAVSSSSSPKPERPRAADDFAEILRAKRARSLNGDAAYPKAG
jgi:hypothetical protein